MNKRGQFFIVGAIILALVLFILMTVVNTYREENLLEDFPDLTNNYKTESVKVINDELLNNLNPNPQTKLDTFTEKFVSYARTIDPKLGFVYIYGNDKGQTFIYNYLQESIGIFPVTKNPASTIDLFSESTNTLNDISLDVDGFQFKKTIPVKISNYGKEYYSEESTGNFYVEIAGIFYPIKGDQLNNQFSYVATSSGSGGQVSVDIS